MAYPDPQGSRPVAPRELCVSGAQAGQRLDRLLARELGIAAGAARRLLDLGIVRLGDRVLGRGDKGRFLAAGERLTIGAFDPPGHERALPAPEIPLEVLAEGAGWVALDKPAGVPVHPLRADEGATLLGALLLRHPEMQGTGEGGLRSGVVHRLDVDTSGALLFALDEPSWRRLRSAFAEHRVEKVYHAVVDGHFDAGHRDAPMTQRLALSVARHKPARVRVMNPAAASSRETGGDAVRIAEQQLRPLRELAGATLVEVRPRTGFLHQIRATLAHLGHPVLGDRVYAPPGSDVAGRAPRQLLHARSLCFEEVAATAPYPADWVRAVAALEPEPEPEPE